MLDDGDGGDDGDNDADDDDDGDNIEGLVLIFPKDCQSLLISLPLTLPGVHKASGSETARLCWLNRLPNDKHIYHIYCIYIFRPRWDIQKIKSFN